MRKEVGVASIDISERFHRFVIKKKDLVEGIAKHGLVKQKYVILHCTSKKEMLLDSNYVIFIFYFDVRNLLGHSTSRQAARDLSLSSRQQVSQPQLP